MTSDNQQPQKPTSHNQSPEQASDLNSSQAILSSSTQLYTHTTLPEQRGPAWSPSSRPMPAKQYQKTVGPGRVSPSTPWPPQTLSQQPPVITITPAHSPKRPRKRTPLIVFLLLLSALVAIGAI